jgi:hypothetical protein
MSQIKIPVSLVPRAYVDYDMEQQQILRHDFVLPDGFRVPPLTAARLMALELICSDFFLQPDTCGQLDIAAALVLLTCRQSLVEELTRKAPSASEAADYSSGGAASREASCDSVDSAARTGDTDFVASRSVATAAVEGLPSSLRGLSAYPNLAAAAASLLQAHGDAILADYSRLVRWCIQVPFYGFDMIPKTGPAQQKPCWFDGEFAGSVIAQASKILATPVEFVLWETPLCLVWHAIAQHAAAFGVKHVERPPDEAVLKQMMTEAAEREARGELHTWQYADPISYGLTDAQANANPALIGLFARMRSDFERGGHKPLDPADYPIPATVASRSVATITIEAPPPAGNTPTSDCVLSVFSTKRLESVEDAGTAFSTISVQDLSWSLRGSSANNVAIEHPHV